MKKIAFVFALASGAMFVSCGANSDVARFCECVADHEGDKKDENCEKDMEALEAKLKEDEGAYEEFAEGAKKECPDAEKWIERMK